MFRDLKEYQEIAKIYTEKVSKPEDLDERVRGGGMSGSIKPFEKPSPQVSGNRGNRPEMKAGIEIKKPTVQGATGKTRPQSTSKPETDSTGKVIPSTAQIRADAAAKRGGPVTGGGNAGSSTDSGGTSQIKNSSTFTSQGKPRTKAQQMAADRIAAKKASPLTRQLSGRERAQAMARARLAAGKNTVTGESYDQYDQIVDLLISEDYADNVKDAEFIMIQPEFIEGFNGGSIDE